MANQYYGITILGELSDAQTLPSGTSVDSESIVLVGGETNQHLRIQVRAYNDISIADGQHLYIDIETGPTNVQASAVAPFSTAGAVHANTVTAMRIFSILGSGALWIYAAGEIMVDVAVPDKMMALFTTPHIYIQLVYTTSTSEVSERVDAFVYAVAG